MESIALIKKDFVKLCNRDIETSGVPANNQFLPAPAVQRFYDLPVTNACVIIAPFCASRLRLCETNGVRMFQYSMSSPAHLVEIDTQ